MSVVHCIGFAIMNTVYLAILADQVHASNEQITFFQTAYFLGAFLGSFMSFLSRQSPRNGVISGSICLALVMVASIYVSNYWVFFALGAFQSFGRLLTVIGTRTLVQQHAEKSHLGRVMAFRSASIDAGSLVIYAIVVPLSSLLGRGDILVVAALTFLSSLIAIHRQRIL